MLYYREIIKDKLYASLESVVLWSLLFIAAFVLFPHFPSNMQTMVSWSDQRLFLETLDQTIKTGTSIHFRDGSVGPGYISIALLIQKIFNGSPNATLSSLASLSFIVTGISVTIFVNRYIRHFGRAVYAPFMAVSIAVLFTSVWAYSAGIPWTHFTETALLAVFVVVLTSPAENALKYLATGFLLILIYQTRSFEGSVALIALVLTAAAMLANAVYHGRAKEWGRRAALRAPYVLGGAAASILFVYVTTGVWLPFSQYSGYGNTLSLAFSLFPLKLVQLFVEPCFMTFCRDTHTVPGDILAIQPNLGAWRQPLALQLPSLVASAIAIAVLLARSAFARRRLLSWEVAFPLLTAGGAILAYTSGVPSGSPHLKYGFMRDFVAPTVLLYMAMSAMVGARVERGHAESLHAPAVPAITALIVFLAVTAALMVLRPFSADFLSKYSIAHIAYSPDCDGDTCHFNIDVKYFDGENISIPGLTVYDMNCGGKAVFGVADIRDISLDKGRCKSIKMIPAITGLLFTPNGYKYISQPATGGGENAKGQAAAPAQAASAGPCGSSAPKVEFGKKVETTSGNRAARCLLGAGWSGPEPWGTWTDGKVARLRLDLSRQPAGDVKLTFDARGFSRSGRQPVSVWANGKKLASIAIDAGAIAEYALTIPRQAFVDGRLSLEFRIADPVSPKTLGVSADSRDLGLGLQWLRLDPAAGTAPTK